MPRFLRALFPLWISVFVVLASACSSSDTQPGSFAEYELFPSTKMLSAEDLATITSSAEDGTLTFASPSPLVASLAAGNVIVGGISKTTPGGLLRVVLAVDRDASGALVLTTAAAPLQLAFRKLHARSAGTIEPLSDAGKFTKTDVSPMGGKLGPRWTVASGTIDKSQTYQIIVFDGDGNPATTNDQVKIDATLTGGFTYSLSIDVDWGAVMDLPKAVTDCIASIKKIVTGKPPSCSVEDFMPELKLVFEVDPRLAAKVTASGAASLGFEKSFDVGTIDLPPFAIGPLVFVPSADIVATVAGRASARFSASAEAHVEIASKATLSSKEKNTKLDPFSIKDADASADTPEVDLFASATAKVGVRLNLALYSVAGPYATASGVAELTANPTANPCWALKLAAEAQIGVRVTSPRLPLLGYVTFVDWKADPFRPFEKTVASGSCRSTPDGENPPGGGPNAKALQSPPFKPWAKILGGSVDGTTVSQPGGFTGGFSQLTPSIDGRYVATGDAAMGVLKVDDRGDGSLTWSKPIVRDGPNGKPLRAIGSVPSADAELVSIFQPDDASAFVIAKQGQSGAIDGVRAYAFSDGCVPVPSLVARDRTSGFVVAGSCRSSGRLWLAHLDATLGLVRARFLDDPDANATRFMPTAIVRVGDDLVLAGERARGNQTGGDGSQMFVVRLDDEENVSAPMAYASPERLGLLPMGAAPSADGAVTFVGDATGVGFVARLKKDDTLGFVTFPQMGTGVRDWFVPTTVAELPTTGLVIGASYGVVGADPPVVALLGLDGAGHTQWANQYGLTSAAGARAVAWPSLRITDDGGVLVSAYAAPEGTATEGGALVAMKVFARDGTLGDGWALKQSALASSEGSYTVAPRTFAPVVTPATMTESAFPFVR